MRPSPITRGARLWLGVAFFVVFFVAWGIATLGGFVPKTFLADPFTMLREGYALFTQHGFAKDVALTVWRVLGGFAIAAFLAVPLGIAMGAWKPVEAFFEPFISFSRYLPASAFIPLLILWAGIGEAQKLSLIFIGAFFPMVLMIAVKVGATRRDLMEAAYTLGCNDWGIVQARAGPGERARDRGDPAHRDGLGVDLRDRGRADRLRARHRPHDHRQPGAAQHRADHLRDHRDRGHRARLRLRLQGDQPAAVPLGRMSTPRLSVERVSRTFPGMGGARAHPGARRDHARRRGQRLHRDPRALGLRQVDAAADRGGPR